MRWFLPFVLWLSMSSVCLAESDFFIMGPGAQSCGEFADAYRIDRAQFERQYFSWAQGFMSGMNLGLRALGTVQPKNLATITTDDQMAHIRRYCNEHPLAEYHEAVIDLFKTFRPSTYRKKDANK
jgi:hypothetical protein